MNSASSTRERLTWLGWLLILTTPAWASLLAPGYFFGAHDAHHSVFYLLEFDAAIRDGAWWPRWGPDHAMGYGYPLWVVYAPFAYYTAEAFHLLGLGLTNAVKATFLLAFLLSASGMFLLVRRWWGNGAGFIAGLLYTYAPYHFVNIYVRAALAEFWAMAWFPWIILAWERLLDKPHDRRRLAAASLSLAALFISHTAVVLFFTPWLAAYLLFRLVWPLIAARTRPPAERAARTLWVSLFSVLAAGLLAVGLAAIFLIPLLAEQRFIGQAVWLRDSYQVERNLVYFFQLFANSWGFGYSVDGPGDGMSFQLGLAPLLLAAGGVWFGLRRAAQQRGIVVFFLLSAVIVAGLMLTPAAALWRLLPLADLLQFPWRMLALTSFCLAIVGGAGAQLLAAPHDPGPAAQRRAALAPLALFIILASATFLQPQWTPITPRDESPLAIMDCELQHPDMIGVMKDTGQSFTETPLLAQYLAEQPLQRAAIVQGAGAVTTLHVGAQSGRLRVDAATPVRLVYYTYNFPGWTLAVDGQPAAIETVAPYGLIGFDLPAGTHDVTLRMGATPARRVGDIVSALSLLIVAWLWRPGRRAPAPRGAAPHLLKPPAGL